VATGRLFAPAAARGPNHIASNPFSTATHRVAEIAFVNMHKLLHTFGLDALLVALVLVRPPYPDPLAYPVIMFVEPVRTIPPIQVLGQRRSLSASDLFALSPCGCGLM